MSVGVVGGAPARTSATAAAVPERPWVRLWAFAALGAYGVERWATLLRPAPGWRLVGLLGVAVALAGGVPLLARRSRLAAAVAGAALLLVALPIAGLPWEWFTHARIAVSADWIGTGLQRLPNVLVPYQGASQPVRLVIVLGAAVLLLDGAAVLACAGRGCSISDGRRATAALPLIALAVVPSTLLRPQLPYVQGILLFWLVAAAVWGERLRPGATGSVLGVLITAAVGAAIAASHLDAHRPWVDYRAWAGTVVHRRVDVFDWNQTYGPLRWPHIGHVVMTVRAATGDYWKAEDLNTFNGVGWVASPAPPAVPAPPPWTQYVRRWSQTIHVTILGMDTRQVIAAGSASPPSDISGGPGADAGTWVAGHVLGPGTAYDIATYSPRPSAAQLAAAGRHYPTRALAPYLALTIPLGKPFEGPPMEVRFPPFHALSRPSLPWPGAPTDDATPVLRSSPYARAYALARRLARQSVTPYGFVAAVKRYLSRGFSYSQTPPVSRYPLESFLFGNREGYCQQFSGAMALLLRMGGIPARVASGFTPGTYDRTGHEWVVTDTDAHAWVEAWFPRYGWVRFDPTPAGTPGLGREVGPVILPRTRGGAPAPGAAARRARTSGASGTVTTAAPHAGSSGRGLSPWPILGGVLGGALVGWLAWLLLRAGGAPADRLTELERAMARTGRRVPPGTTLVGLEGRLSATPEAAAYVRALREARYGGGGAAPTPAQRRALRRELARGLGLGGRARALWALPPRVPGRARS